MAVEAYLGVEASVTGRRWVQRSDQAERDGLAMAQRFGFPEIVGRVLAGRGVPIEAAGAYLEPSLRDLIPDPSRLRDMDVAAERLADAVTGRESIALFGDYDVDGATSTGVVRLWLRMMGHDATLYIPDRIDEGYGPNIPAMQALARTHKLIICLDCGTMSHAPIAAARSEGAEVMVVDHHLPGDSLPECHAVVNPNRGDDDSGMNDLCAAGVAFLLLIAANRALRRRGAFKARPEPDLMSLLDLVALGTVADVAPLRGLNRAYVRRGLEVMARRENIGLTALADAAKLDGRPTSYHLGFLLGPRVNAGGRIGAADLGARLLVTQDAAEAKTLAARLDALNRERREIEAAVQEAALAQIEARGEPGPLVWAAGAGWHPGVVGIVASRLKERYDRPAIVIGVDEAGEGKGSGRSVEGVDLGRAVQRAAAEGLLIKGGGHKMAAGLTVTAEKIPEAMAHIGEALAKQGAGQGGPRDLRLDGAMRAAGATVELCETLEQAGPFGAGAPAPRFVIAGARIGRPMKAGDAHLRCQLLDDNGGRLEAVAFRALPGPLGDFLLDHAGRAVHVAGRLQIDDWGGRRKAKLQIEDAAPAD